MPANSRINQIVQGYATQVPELGKEICAIVEFENEESAKNAVAGFSENDLSQMRVALLGPKLRRNLYHVNHDRLESSHSFQSQRGLRVSTAIIAKRLGSQKGPLGVKVRVRLVSK